jgi:hypothetical protein
VDVAEIRRVADWELTGKELNKTYYHRDLECEPHLSRLFFCRHASLTPGGYVDLRTCVHADVCKFRTALIRFCAV